MLLARSLAITPHELVGARKRWEREGGHFGQVLLRMNLIEEQELRTMLITQRVKKLVHLFSWSWRTGTYVFHRDVSKIDPIPGFSLPYQHVILAGVRTHYDMDRLMMVFGKRGRMTRPVKIKTVSPERLASKSDIEGLKDAIDIARKAKNLAAAARSDAMDELTFLQFVYALFVMDILTFEE